MTRFIVTILLLAAPLQASAESLFTCVYDHYGSDRLKIEKAEGFELRFVVRDDGTASMIGNAGAAPVQPITGMDQITFFETTATGNFMMTTIDFAELKFVHSRHTVMSGGLVPSQYYGKCMHQ